MVMLSSHIILCHPLLLLSIFPSITQSFPIGSSHQVAKVLELQPQHQSFNEYSGLISFSFDSLLPKGFSSVFSSTTIWKHQFFSIQPSLLGIRQSTGCLCLPGPQTSAKAAHPPKYPFLRQPRRKEAEGERKLAVAPTFLLHPPGTRRPVWEVGCVGGRSAGPGHLGKVCLGPSVNLSSGFPSPLWSKCVCGTPAHLEPEWEAD